MVEYFGGWSQVWLRLKLMERERNQGVAICRCASLCVCGWGVVRGEGKWGSELMLC